MSSASPEIERFEKLIEALAATGHGSKELDDIKKFLGGLRKTSKREGFLLPRLLQDALTWHDVKDVVWNDSDEQKEANRFAFLQGDVVVTTTVLALGMAETSQEHDLWLTLAPDCDCVRAPYVRVAAVFPVYKGDKEDVDRTNRFGHALKLNSPKAFPLPPLPGDEDQDLRGYFADFEDPYYIRHDYKSLATPCASMTVEGWHLLNGFIQNRATRAFNISEAVMIRSCGAR